MNKEIALRWAGKADRDILLASQLDETLSDMAAYHYQQAAEKYLTAFLAYHQVALKKTHNIGTLALQASNIDSIFRDWIQTSTCLHRRKQTSLGLAVQGGVSVEYRRLLGIEHKASLVSKDGVISHIL